MKKSKLGKYLSNKKFIYVFLALVILLFILWYAYSWYKVKEKEKLRESYLITTSTVTSQIESLNEIEPILQEAPAKYFVYISYTGDEEILNLEKRLKNIIDTYNLKDEFYYVNVTKLMENENYLNEINDTFKTNRITNLPTLLYYENGTIVKIINGIFTNKEIKTLLNNNGYEVIK